MNLVKVSVHPTQGISIVCQRVAISLCSASVTDTLADESWA